MALHTALGCYGYSIYKSGITTAQYRKIKSDLTVKPFTPMAETFGPASKPVTYPIYLEYPGNPRIYMPYFYGLREFGIPQKCKLPEPTAISAHHATYTGHTPREVQVPVIEAYMAAATDDTTPKRGGILELHTGFGKTLIAMNIISRLRLKTIIIVHKEFLLGQWVENIERSLPHARIGRIQGEVVDVTDKDVVIGMLQSLSQKEYPAELFSQFGLLIVDEAHHISSEVFIRALAKITTRCTLGLSATINRKDDTTWAIKDYLGPIIYSVKKRAAEHDVVVRAIEYRVPDSVYADVKCDFKGNPLYSCMISAICEYHPRTNFIIEQIWNALVENPHQQIMVLAQNRNVLNYMHEAIAASAEALRARMLAAGHGPELADQKTGPIVGFYLGGMKQRDLKVSEGRTIILATFAMAAEALDIPTLTTLFMITSKSDIVQSVGRILRAKNASSPVIYDIIDHHPVFKNQWQRQRLPFYRGENYRVIWRSVGDGNLAAPVRWKTIHEPVHEDDNSDSSGAAVTAKAAVKKKTPAPSAQDFSVCLF
jgi:superfamily II DNA or RNA helicase